MGKAVGQPGYVKLRVKGKGKNRSGYSANEVRRASRNGTALYPPIIPHPAVEKLVWTKHAIERFHERVASGADVSLLDDFVRGRKPEYARNHRRVTELERKGAHITPYVLDVKDVCRLVVDWVPIDKHAPDANTRGVWVVVTCYEWAKVFHCVD